VADLVRDVNGRELFRRSSFTNKALASPPLLQETYKLRQIALAAHRRPPGLVRSPRINGNNKSRAVAAEPCRRPTFQHILHDRAPKLARPRRIGDVSVTARRALEPSECGPAPQVDQTPRSGSPIRANKRRGVMVSCAVFVVHSNRADTHPLFRGGWPAMARTSALRQ